jgi:hypothetical protein
MEELELMRKRRKKNGDKYATRVHLEPDESS